MANKHTKQQRRRQIKRRQPGPCCRPVPPPGRVEAHGLDRAIPDPDELLHEQPQPELGVREQLGAAGDQAPHLLRRLRRAVAQLHRRRLLHEEQRRRSTPRHRRRQRPPPVWLRQHSLLHQLIIRRHQMRHAISSSSSCCSKHFVISRPSACTCAELTNYFVQQAAASSHPIHEQNN